MATNANHRKEGAAGDEEHETAFAFASNFTSATESIEPSPGNHILPAYPTHRHLDIYPSYASNGTLENNKYLQDLAQGGSGATNDWATYDSQDPVPSISLDIHATLGLPYFGSTPKDGATATLPDLSNSSEDSLAWPHAGRRSIAEAIAAGDTQPVGVIAGRGGAVEGAPGAEGEKHWSVHDMNQAEEEEQSRQSKVDLTYLKPVAGQEEDGDGDVAMTDTKGAQKRDSIVDEEQAKAFPAAPEPDRRVLDFGPHWELISGPLPHSTAIIKHYLDNRQPVDIDRLRDFLEHVSASMPSTEAFDQFVVALRMWITRQISYEALVDWLVYFFSAKPDLLERSNVLLGTIAKLTSAVVEPEPELAVNAETDLTTQTQGVLPATSSSPGKLNVRELRPSIRNEKSRSGSGSGASSATPSTDAERSESDKLRNLRSPSSTSYSSSATTPSTGSGHGTGVQAEADQRTADAARESEEGRPSPSPGKLEIDVVYSCPLGVYKRRIVLDRPAS